MIWRDSSVAKSKLSSCRRPKFGSQNPHGAPHKHWQLQFQGITGYGGTCSRPSNPRGRISQEDHFKCKARPGYTARTSQQAATPSQPQDGGIDAISLWLKGQHTLPLSQPLLPCDIISSALCSVALCPSAALVFNAATFTMGISRVVFGLETEKP